MQNSNDYKDLLAFVKANKGNGSKGQACYNITSNNFTAKAKELLEQHAEVKALLCTDKCNMPSDLNKAFLAHKEYLPKLEKMLAECGIALKQTA